MKKITKHLHLLYAICLIPLIVQGLYKNGLELYIKGLVPFMESIKPLLIILMSIAGAFLGSLIKEIKNNKKLSLKYLDKLKSVIIASTVFASILPVKSSPIIVFVVSFISYILFDNGKINTIALVSVVTLTINHFLKLNIYENAYQLSNTLNYNGMDLFLGNGVGGICSTNVLIMILSLLVLSSNDAYKKEQVISSIFTYSICVAIFMMMTSNYQMLFIRLFSYNTIFAYIFMSPHINSSCYTVKGQILSGVLIAIMTFVISFIAPYYAAPLSILFITLFSKIIDRIFVIK